MLTYSPSVRRALAALFALALIWGYNWVVMKRALAYMGPFQFAAARMLLAALMLFAVVIVTKRPWRPRALPQTLLIGLLQTCGFSALIMWALLAAGAALAGLTCILEPWHLHGSLLSDVLAVAAGLCWALAVILAKRLQRRGPAVDVLEITARQKMMGALQQLELASLLGAARDIVGAMRGHHRRSCLADTRARAPTSGIGGATLFSPSLRPPPPMISSHLVTSLCL